MGAWEEFGRLADEREKELIVETFDERLTRRADEAVTILRARKELWFRYREHARHPENGVSSKALAQVGQELGLV